MTKMKFRWDGTWEGGEDLTGVIGREEQYWNCICANCGQSRRNHIGHTSGLECPIIAKITWGCCRILGY